MGLSWIRSQRLWWPVCLLLSGCTLVSPQLSQPIRLACKFSFSIEITEFSTVPEIEDVEGFMFKTQCLLPGG